MAEAAIKWVLWPTRRFHQILECCRKVEAAYEEEDRRGQTVLFPIRLDDAVMETTEAWAAKLRRSRHIGDFRQWKDHDRYKEAFQRVLRDLKAAQK